MLYFKNLTKIKFTRNCFSLDSLPKFFSNNCKKIILNEDDLETSFVRGWGPGGQHVNRTSNCVVMKHVPTGIVVKCQKFRVLEDNKREARKRITRALDLHYNGNESQFYQEKVEQSRRENLSQRRSKLRLEAKRSFKERIKNIHLENNNNNKID